MKVYERYIPPHNGIGSEEDTLRSCNSTLIPGKFYICIIIILYVLLLFYLQHNQNLNINLHL
jgi:hypothetical protein